ncbi:MAG: thioredoxin domain-containing protein [Thiotrichales bacterium]|jgi:protein-disulfide isomerase|nr:thioredoxin domain-containing protein [Thiotrichales bacterium]MBT4262423.1 thioredoxin domain-containing protein [Thiotrichales bacterium]MBT5290740.1 thioredoxin domain-containing protein [Thiotrichales bacterium]MBT5419126.1 thioredoxin domain-containing protein [Thiotrichales bacterium]
MKNKFIVAAVAILFVGLFIAAADLYNNQKNSSLNSATLENIEYIQRDYSPTLGPVDAKVTIVEFFDPACGTCRSFYPLVKRIMSENEGRVNLVLRYLPLHNGSDVIITIFEAARLQGLFWETLKLAYKRQDAWVVNHISIPAKLWGQLDGIGLDMDKLAVDMKSVEIARRVKQDLADAKQLKVNKTPGFFVNGKPLINFGYKQLQQLVASEIDEQYP